MSQGSASRNFLDQRLIVAAGLASIFFPSAIAGTIVPVLTVWQCALISLMLSIRLWRGEWIAHNLALAAAVLILLLAFTLTSPLPEIAPGGLMPYALLLTVLVVDLRRVAPGRFPWVALLIVNLILLGLGFATLMGLEPAIDLLEAHYKAYDDELFASMIAASFKPVTVFSSHSIAALSYFALLLLSLRLARSEALPLTARRLLTASACGYVALLPMLASNTAFALLLPALAMLAWHVLRFLRPATRIAAIAGLGAASAFAVVLAIDPATIDALSETVATVWSYDAGGFLGRYASGGRLQPTYDFLIEHHFLPIGLSYSPAIALGDNFIAEYVIKISIIGYLAVLAMLWAWLGKHIPERRSRVGFMLLFLLADLGYPLLPYPRAAGFLPLFVLLWTQFPPKSAT